MRYLVTGKEMKLLDKNTSEHFKVPELVLMEQAAMHFVWKFCDLFEFKKGIVFCGSGNNGADGIAIARLLNERGIDTEVCKVNTFLSQPARPSDSFLVQETIYETYGYPVSSASASVFENHYDFIIDAVFGIGLSRELGTEYNTILHKIDQMSGVKIAVDMPSGVHSDHGAVMGTAIRCDHTITFSFAKTGQLLWPGCEYAGEVHVVDMGITQRSWLQQTPSFAVLDIEDLAKWKVRPAHSNKGTFGKLLVIAGSKNMAGAAVFSAKAAYRCGVGLVKVVTPEENRMILQTNVPEALLSVYKDHIEEKQLQADMDWADAIVIGPGLGRSENSRKFVSFVQKNALIPVVWDADALNILAEEGDFSVFSQVPSVITPHLGEFSRLTGNTISWIQNHFLESAVDFARAHGVICVLKDFRTITAAPLGLSYLNLSGNNGMATGGSGDVLAGMIGAFLAQGQSDIEAASIGVFLHGKAGDAAREKMGTYAMTASDLIESLKDVWKGIEHA